MDTKELHPLITDPMNQKIGEAIATLARHIVNLNAEVRDLPETLKFNAQNDQRLTALERFVCAHADAKAAAKPVPLASVRWEYFSWTEEFGENFAFTMMSDDRINKYATDGWQVDTVLTGDLGRRWILKRPRAPE